MKTFMRGYYRRKRSEAMLLVSKELGLSAPKCVGSPRHQCKGKLELHHKRYYPDSVRAGNGLMRVFEALRHPRRFLIYCQKFHLIRHAATASFTSKIGSDKRSAIAGVWERRMMGKGRPTRQEYIDHYVKKSFQQRASEFLGKDFREDDDSED